MISCISRILTRPEPTAPKGPSEPLLVVLGSVSLAIEIAARHPEMNILVFESDWSSVDRARLEVEAHGLESRITVHHSAAAELAWWASRLVTGNPPRCRPRSAA